MKTKQKIMVNRDARLFVIPSGSGYSCLGFDVCQDRINRLSPELSALGHNVGKAPRKGTVAQYNYLSDLQEIARKQNEATGWRSKSGLTSELIGLEGRRVEIRHQWKSGLVETVRFQVGKSCGWMPCHLMIERRTSNGGCAVCLGDIQSVRIVR